MSVIEQTYKRLALDEPERRWELHQGVVREKPLMAYGHQHALRRLARTLYIQLDPAEFEVGVNASRVRYAAETFFIPDLFVIPVQQIEFYRGRGAALEVFAEPLPLVVEIWSPSTGDYDIDTKIPMYRTRGDLEIWRVHPFERTLTVWRRQADGGDTESVYNGGTIAPVAWPGVTVEIDALFE